ncbi:FAD-dependent oxidoreductase [Paenibacillus sp. J5C_2022]|uniref:FAD-dependent oxidoreductase n=1 Tax=Paenibacillus sp. J5C2022 TaxID=2977129 RepID=UPI0021CE75AF|nr:FAD-dependent oxidoreductase [Paenibacillus sp. J5C2022]MCU6709061.1 FAD-dependent oxidoreductase [Paenibacillus sp. J5C2022]
MSKKRLYSIAAVMVVLLGACAGWFYIQGKEESPAAEFVLASQKLKQVVSVEQLQDTYDVIVVGTDPEGISAAVSAARNGAKTLLIENRQRELLGGLMTVGWLNSIDMNWDRTSKPLPGREQDYYNKGIFKEWYKKTEGHSFDVTTAANAFYDLVSKESNIDLYMSAQAVEPIVSEGSAKAVEGIALTNSDGSTQNVLARSVIDATQDADIAAAAGVQFTMGREDIGDPDSRMAVTAVFRLKNMDDKAWKLISDRLNGDGDGNTGVSKMSAWGYGKEMSGYLPLDNERTKMRGLNIGRQRDGTVLINALHIFDIDGLDPESREEGLELARQEIPNVVEYLKEYKEFKHAELDAVAPELYVRETRHMVGLYRLSIVDLLENRDHWDRIAFGSYPADIQRTSPSDNGAVVLHPLKYAVPFRSIVPKDIDGLLVVGRSASYDTLAHGSARVIPTGMAEGQAAGAAAKLAEAHGITFRELAASKPLIEELQQRLNDQGMELEPYTLEPQSYMKHKDYAGLKAAVYMGLAYGSYGNAAFDLDRPSNAQRMVNQMNGARRMFPEQLPGDPYAAVNNVEEPANKPLSLQQACLTIAEAAGVETSREQAVNDLLSKSIITQTTVDLIADPEQLTDGEAYMLLKDAIESLTEIEFGASSEQE